MCAFLESGGKRWVTESDLLLHYTSHDRSFCLLNIHRVPPKGLSAFWSRRARLYSLIPPPMRNTVFQAAHLHLHLAVYISRPTKSLHTARSPTPGAAHRKAQPLSISNSFGAVLFVANFEPHMFLSCVPFSSVVIGHINGGWLCFGWTGGFSGFATPVGWKGRLFGICFWNSGFEWQATLVLGVDQS